MCRFDLSRIIVSDNGTRFTRTAMISFCNDLGVQIKFISVIHPEVNRQVEFKNIVLLKGDQEKA